jgi:hypothetical protein
MKTQSLFLALAAAPAALAHTGFTTLFRNGESQVGICRPVTNDAH